MNFDLSENQELFKSTAEKFLQSVDVSSRLAQRETDFGYDLSRWTTLADLGLFAIVAREKFGGMSGSKDDLAVIAETFGRRNAFDPWLENGALPTLLADRAGAEEVLTSLLDGSKVASLAFAEADGRYSLMPKSTKATMTQDGFSLTGEKQFVLGGKISDILFVTALLDGKFSVFWLPQQTAGLSSRYYRVSDGSWAAVIEFQSVAIPKSNKLNVSFEEFQNVVSQINILACAELVGLSQLLLDDTIAYVNQRKQFGVSIGSFQAIQHGLVDCYADMEQIRSTLLRTLLVPAKNSEDERAKVFGAKAFIAKRADKIARTAVQYHGAMGITEEVEIGHALKRIMLLERLFGDKAICLEEYAKAN